MDIEELRELVYGTKGQRKNFPKILIYDVETAPIMAYVWKRWKTNVSLDQTISEWFMICWSAKWLYSDSIMGECLTPEEALKQDDSRIVKKLWKLVDEADIVVAYNGKRADVPWMNTRFIVHGMQPPKPYFVVDPCDAARKKFGFSSNKMDALAGYFGIEHKMETGGFDLWKRCMYGEKEALNKMLLYNNKDVQILEEVYLKMLPWLPQHPNLANLMNENCCCKCGSTDYRPLKGKYYYTSVSKYQLFRCSKCGTVFRGRMNLNPKKAVNLIST